METKETLGSKEASDRRETVLEEAGRLVYGDRQADYGKARDSFDLTAKLWAPILGVLPTAEQVALCMLQLKVARYLYKPKRDSLVDMAGYVACIEKIENGE